MTYHGDRRYYCVSCKQPVGKTRKREHTDLGHILVGRPRKKRQLVNEVKPVRVRWGEIWFSRGGTIERPTARFVLEIYERTAGLKDGIGVAQWDLLAAGSLDDAKGFAVRLLPAGAEIQVRSGTPESIFGQGVPL